VEVRATTRGGSSGAGGTHGHNPPLSHPEPPAQLVMPLPMRERPIVRRMDPVTRGVKMRRRNRGGVKEKRTATRATVEAVPSMAPNASGHGSLEPSSASLQLPRANSLFRNVKPVLTCEGSISRRSCSQTMLREHSQRRKRCR